MEYFKYNALDRLTCSTFSPASVCPTAGSYTYAPDGNLLTKPELAGTCAYDLKHPHAVQAAGTDSCTYDLVGNQTTRSGAVFSYTAFDVPRAFTPAPGQGGAPRNPLWVAAPVAFSSVTARGFTGHQVDEELDLVNMKGRLCNPQVGRFLTADPIVSHPGFGQSWNPYSYVPNNSLAFTEPSGFNDTAPEWLIPSPCGSDCTQSPDGTLNAWHTPLLPQVRSSPNVEAWLAGLTTVPVDRSATGNATASTPQALADGGGEFGGAGPCGALCAGGGADSGGLTQAALHPVDYLGFQQDMNAQSRQHAVMAVLAPVRFPLIVGVIAFGLLNPDPVYAPTFQTTTDRPSVMERAGQTGLAAAVGALGVWIGQARSAADSGTYVYQLVDQAGDAVYYGISNNPTRRLGEHALEATKPFNGLQVISEQQPLAQAQALERSLIDHAAAEGRTIYNVAPGSISPLAPVQIPPTVTPQQTFLNPKLY